MLPWKIQGDSYIRIIRNHRISYDNTTVSVGTDVNDMTQFLEEALRMRSFSHEHVLTMMGIVDLDGRPYVVLPYMANGDLKTYLSDDKRVRDNLGLTWILTKTLGQSTNYSFCYKRISRQPIAAEWRLFPWIPMSLGLQEW